MADRVPPRSSCWHHVSRSRAALARTGWSETVGNHDHVAHGRWTGHIRSGLATWPARRHRALAKSLSVSKHNLTFDVRSQKKIKNNPNTKTSILAPTK